MVIFLEGAAQEMTEIITARNSSITGVCQSFYPWVWGNR